MSLAVLVSVGGGAAAGRLVPDVASSAGDVTGREPLHLPAVPAVGHAARTSTAIETTLDEVPVSLMVTTSSAITAVSGDGSYTTRSTINALDVTGAPASADISHWGFDGLAGVTFDQHFGADGSLLSAGARSVNAESLVLDSLAMANIGFPAEPVSVGESWTMGGRIGSSGMSVNVTYQCRLAAVVDRTYTMDVSYAEYFTDDVDGVSVEGTISGSGTLTGSLDNPLVANGNLYQTIDGVSTADGAATPMRVYTAISLTTTSE